MESSGNETKSQESYIFNQKILQSLRKSITNKKFWQVSENNMT